jgi:hypothetical protein
MKFDPRLLVPENVAALIHDAVGSMSGALGPFVASVFDEPLAVEMRNGDLWVRAATGDEVTEMLTTGGHDEEEGIDWRGDPAEATGQRLVWAATADDEEHAEPACRLWAGEVILKDGSGVAGPFYVHEAAARAWAYSTALGLPRGDVFEAQVVPYACARSCAPDLIRHGDEEYHRINRFWASPIRPWGAPMPVPLPQPPSTSDR